MRTVHFIGGPINGHKRCVDGAARNFPVIDPLYCDGRLQSFGHIDYQIHALVYGAHVHHVATLPGSPDPIAQLLAAYFKE